MNFAAIKIRNLQFKIPPRFSLILQGSEQNMKLFLKNPLLCDLTLFAGGPAKRPQILRHSEAYKNFLNKLIIQKQVGI